MKLQPLTEAPVATYPTRRHRQRNTTGWLRRLGVAACASAALGFAGCYGLTPMTDDLPDGGDLDADTFGEPDVGEGDADVEVDGDVVELPPVTECEAEPRMSGMMAPTNYFACGEELPDSTPITEAPLYLGAGELCGSTQSAWARFQVTEAGEYRVMVLNIWEDMAIGISAPDGREVAQVTREAACAQLHMEPGLWVLEAYYIREPDSPSGWFEFAFDLVPAEE